MKIKSGDKIRVLSGKEKGKDERENGEAIRAVEWCGIGFRQWSPLMIEFAF